MKAVRWTDWVLDPTSEQPALHTPKPNDLIWQDPITETIFFMPQDEYERMYQRLHEQISRLSSDEIFWSVWHHDGLPFGTKDELQLAPHLPYPMPLQAHKWSNASEQERKRTRLSDHVIIRTGLYYALHHPDKQEWPGLRKQLLQIDAPIARAIDHFLTTGQWIDTPRKLALIKAGAVKIKQYFMETNNLQEVRGASLLLDELNRQRIIHLLAEHWTPEILVYSGGGNFLILCPEAESLECAKKIDDLFRQVTVTAKCVAHAEIFDINELSKERFQHSLSWLEMKKTEQQMLMLPPNPEDHQADINAYCPDEDKLNVPISVTPLNDHERQNHLEQTDSFLCTSTRPLCQQCRQRTASVEIYPYQNTTKLCCQACLHKIIAGKNRSIFIEEMTELLKRTGIPFTERPMADTLKDLVDNAPIQKEYLAVVYGDGNNMGAIVEKIQFFQTYRYFSHLTASITKYALYTTLYEVLLRSNSMDKIPFEIIAVGGDDLFFIVPAKYGLETAKRLGRKFDAAFRTHPSQENVPEKLTLSIGVCLAHYKVPLTVMFNTAQELLKSAKQAKKQNDLKGGTIDFMKVETSTSFAQHLQTYRQLNHMRSIQTASGRSFTLHHLMRPYTWDQMDALQTFIAQLKNHVQGARHLILRLRNAILQMTVKEANLYYLVNFCATNHQDEQQKSRHKLHELYHSLQQGPLVQKGRFKEMYHPFIITETDNEECLYAPWHDLIELWDIEEGTLWPENRPSSGT